ncbi:PAS domain S-box-containing protein/diguanylate cyclase (GGDEF) domain-containing protein [Marinilactibacillus piezotolerans]|uniref:PAS domain S-box-containing protein/diguanylate cyclase (GGDEF) domain-containing protein n=1 Tax=Marinilactibacillus piezotolerans TaxID=258723 RepID=A0A1I3YWY9_9LACT|nr:diguanylate cyclase [Marinilactibacillus piezotolerans]SFK36345.1 PAS domain S-box-containing protein/diguanylate cyclase (GGDEF) domain-containing protein [Marinilactibacillus piezotolerans]
MKIKKENKIWLIALTGFILFYFLWLLIWQDNEYLRISGGNVFSIIGTFIPSMWLLSAYRKSKLKINKVYWLLLFLSTFSYLIGEIFSFYSETILIVPSPSLSLYEIFYMASVLFCLFAFVFIIWRQANKAMFTKFIFDIGVVMTVSITFSWYYILEPFIEQGNVSLLSLSVNLYYPIIDILLLLCVSAFYFGGEEFFSKRVLNYILIGLSIQIFSGSIHFFEIAQGIYFSGKWIDPLFILPELLIGYTALIGRESERKTAIEIEKLDNYSLSIWQLILPYLLVIFLFFFMITKSNGLDMISVGSGLSITFVLLRQFVVISENRKLVKQYYQKTEELAVSEERYRSLFEYHPDSVFSFDLQGKIESMNSVGATLIGDDPNALNGFPIADFIEQHYTANQNEQLSTTKNEVPSSHEFTLKNKDGSDLNIDMTHIPILVKNKLVGSFGIGRDITEKKLNEEKIHFYAYHDYLTGLGNRRLFEEKLTHLLKQAKEENLTFAILFVDVDKFKEINDHYGHEAGDILLSALADRIKIYADSTALSARMGGDEFTILIKEIAEYNVQEEIAALSKLLNEPYSVNDIEIHCTSSIGFAYYPTDGTTLTELLSKADSAMYRVKKSGKPFR